MANPKKLSPEWIENQVLSEEYITRGERFMVCIIYTKGGYYVTGESAPINPEEFKDELGRKYSREEALDKIWRIEGLIARKQHYGDDAPKVFGIDSVTPEQLEELKALFQNAPSGPLHVLELPEIAAHVFAEEDAHILDQYAHNGN